MEAERLAMEQAVREQQRDVADAASTGFEADREGIKTEFKTIYSEVERVVEKPIYRDICVDTDGLRILSSAISGTRTASSEPAIPMPKPVDPK